jgi:hypothetical protein
VNSEVIADLILMYAHDKIVISPFVRVMNLAGRGSPTAAFPQWELDDVEDVTTEGTTTLSNVELQTTEVTPVTAAQIGILREVTDFALETNIFGPDEIKRFIVEDAGRLCMLEVETDLAALFSGFTASVGTSGADLSVANFLQAIAALDTANARGARVCVLDDQQASDLRLALAASTASVFANAAQNAQTMLNASGTGFMGTLFDVPTYLTNLTTTANTNADVVGAMFIDGTSDPQYAGLGMALLWQPRVKSVLLPDAVAEQIAVTMAYGVGRISQYGCEITTDA